MRRGMAFIWVVIHSLTVAVPLWAQSSDSPPPPPETPPTAPETPAKEPTELIRQAAKAEFEKGLGLVRKEAYAPALTAFLKSLELFRTRTATINAAYCLERLQRYDESLDLYEAYLRDYPNAPADEKLETQKSVSKLRELVGTVEILGAKPGASITVDSRERGDFPLPNPIRVPAGTHVIRLYKQGYHPFEVNVDITGGQTKRINAQMRPLSVVGKLRVAEKKGASLDLLIDNVNVGKTPWEGPLSPGPHLVFLRGEGIVGSQPAMVTVTAQKTSLLVLRAENLSVSMRLQAVPADAALMIDGVPLGQGVWIGQLHAGLHRVEVHADGYLTEKRDIETPAFENKSLDIQLRRDPESPRWKLPSLIVGELSGRLGIVPSLNGEISSQCTGGCREAMGSAVSIRMLGAYELPSGWSLGVFIGYAHLAQTLSNRAMKIQPVGWMPFSAKVTEEQVLSGFYSGAHVGVRPRGDWPLSYRLGVGLLVGTLQNIRLGSYVSADQLRFAIPETEMSMRAYLLHIDPEVAWHIKLSDAVEGLAGIHANVWMRLTKPEWDDKKLVDMSSYGIGTFARETLIGPVIVAPSLHLGLRYTF